MLWSRVSEGVIELYLYVYCFKGVWLCETCDIVESEWECDSSVIVFITLVSFQERVIAGKF